MKRSGLHTLDFSQGFLSAFDISGSLLFNDPNIESKSDIDQLKKDQEKLAEDYKKAYVNILDDKAI